MSWNFFIFYDYVIARGVIGHDDFGHPVVRTENSGIGQYNRLTIYGLQ